MACSVYALTACSEKEDGPKDLNPVTVTEMAKMAYRGEDFVIKGTGFDPSAKFALKDEAGKETPLEIVGEITATEVKLVIPADLKAGKYTIILTQNGEWELAEVTVAGILNIVYPMELYIGEKIVIEGQGFDETVKVCLETEDGERAEAQGVKVIENGIECQVPDVPKNIYTIICIQDEKEYKSDKVVLGVYKKLKSIGELIAGYWEHTAWDENGPIDSIWYEPSTNFTKFTYNEGLLDQVETPDGDVVKITYPDKNTIEAESEIIESKFVVNGKIVQTCDMYDYGYYDTYSYTWSYVDGYLEKITSTSADAPSVCEFSFVDGDLKDFILKDKTHSFAYGSQLAYGLDIAVWITTQNDYSLPYAVYLDLFGKKSLHLPTKYYGGDGVDLQYEFDDDGFVIKLTIPALDENSDAKVYEFVWE